jgi:hypothetical protein
MRTRKVADGIGNFPNCANGTLLPLTGRGGSATMCSTGQENFFHSTLG